MAGTRSSARQAANKTSTSPSSASKGTEAGTKRKADDTSSPTAASKAKRGRPSKKEAEQKTIEETMPDADADGEHDDDGKNGGAPGGPSEDGDEMQVDGNGGVDGNANGNAKGEFERPKGCEGFLNEDNYSKPEGGEENKAQANGDSKDKSGGNDDEKGRGGFEGKTKEGENKDDPEKSLKDSRGGSGLNALDKVKADEEDQGKTSKEDEASEEPQTDEKTAQQDAIKEDKQREKELPSNVLEHGIVYFFTRGRVGVEDPDSVQDLARSYFVLRPLPAGAKLTDGSLQDTDNNRLFALPKKVWPKSGKDRFMSFVEQAKVTIATLKDNFFSGSEYSTKTTGTRHQPGVTPVGEGVYALTTTGGGQGTTHLVYMMTIPSEIGEVQKDIGLTDKGSFVVSLKNPESSGPANAQLPQGPDWPKEFIEEFSGRGWMPAHPKHLDYANAQVLLIGENFDSSNNLGPTAKDEKNDEKETPQEVLEKLEHEDDLRVEHLKGDDTIFADLGISSKEYPSVMTTW